MKKLVVAGAVALLGLASGVANAATVGSTFAVNVALTSSCTVSSGASAMTFNYAAFGGAVNSNSTAVTYQCTRSFPVTGVAFDAVNGDATGDGVIGGLAYTLTATAGAVTVGSAPNSTPGSLAAAGATTRVYNITGSMGAGQAGDSAAATTHNRTLILTF